MSVEKCPDCGAVAPDGLHWPRCPRLQKDVAESCERTETEAVRQQRAGSVSPVVGDGEVLDHLERALKSCPELVIKYNDDPDVEDELGMVPIGFSIRTDGCQGLWSVSGATLRECIRADILKCWQEEARMGGTAETQNVGMSDREGGAS